MKKLLLPLLLTATLCSCYNDNEEDLYPAGTCDSTNVTYSQTVKPIITANCTMAGCHAGTIPANGINLEDYSGLKVIATSGQLLGSINHSTGYSAMPKNLPKLSECNLSQIARWVADGAPNN